MKQSSFYKSIITTNLVMVYLLIALSSYSVILAMQLLSPMLAIIVSLTSFKVPGKYDAQITLMLTVASMINLLAVISMPS